MFSSNKSLSSISLLPRDLRRRSEAAQLLGSRVRIRRYQWPSGLRRVSAADRLLWLRVRIPPGAWMFVLVCCTKKDKRQGQDNQDKEVQIK